VNLLEKQQMSGSYQIQWQGNDKAGRPAASGIYFLKIQIGQENQVFKMMLLK